MYTFFKIITPIFLLSIVCVVGWFAYKWYSEPAYKTGNIEKGEVLVFRSARLARYEGDLKVISYNIGFAAGPMQHSLADDHPESFYKNNLDGFVSLVKKQRADVVLLQEVDIDSKRSWYFNQLEYIMKELGWGYAAPVVDWDMFFPLRKERKIEKATVVISRYPIVSNEYTLTSGKPNFENRLLNIFYYPLLWKSCMQKVGIDLGGRVLDVYNVHLCVWNRDARVGQAEFLVDWIKNSGTENEFIVGGDFNFQAYIRGTPKPEEDMQKPSFLNVFWDNFDGLGELLSDKNCSNLKIHENFTFPERKHRYDFIFYSSGMKLVKGKVIKGTDVSDHLPVAGTFSY